VTEEYQAILKNADQLQAEYRMQPCHLERLYDILAALYKIQKVIKPTTTDPGRKVCSLDMAHQLMD
jgi:hypothetical protein